MLTAKLTRMVAAIFVAMFLTHSIAFALEDNPATKSPDEYAAAFETRITAVCDLLSSGKKSVTDILTAPQYDDLRPITKFREAIRDHAKPGPVTLVTKHEPGTPLHVTGLVHDKSDKPIQNALIYLYHTDHRGWHGGDRPHFLMNSGDIKHARLFAYLRTDKDGKFEFRTIRPAGYPKSDLPQHIHFHVEADGFENYGTEILFDDDPRMTAQKRKDAENSGDVITRPVADATGVFNIHCDIPMSNK